VRSPAVRDERGERLSTFRNQGSCASRSSPKQSRRSRRRVRSRIGSLRGRGIHAATKLSTVGSPPSAHLASLNIHGCRRGSPAHENIRTQSGSRLAELQSRGLLTVRGDGWLHHTLDALCLGLHRRILLHQSIRVLDRIERNPKGYRPKDAPTYHSHRRQTPILPGRTL
jgi:hypothetical protein